MKTNCRRVYGLLCPVILIAVMGCSSIGSYNTATGRREFIIISTPEEVQMGNQVHRKILQEYVLSDNERQQERIRKIGEQLVLVSDRQDYEYHFYLVKKNEMNAFTTPGGNIYFFTGLMDHLKTDDEIAAVLAHEIGHCAARHTVKKFQAALGYGLVGGLVLNRLEGEKARHMTALTSGVVMNLIFSAYSRRDEYEADRLGIKYMDLAGYDINKMITTLEVLKAESKKGYTPLILRSHPYLEDRIEAVKQEIQRVQRDELSADQG